MKLNKYILEAINKGVLLALDDYEDIENNEPITSKSNIIKDEESIKNLIEFNKQFIDLGLPSGTLWAKYNLGCDWNKLINDPSHSKPNEWYGNYYAWGETQPKETYSWDTYEHGYGPYSLYKYVNNSDNAADDNDNKTDDYTVLLPEDDAAYQANHKMKIPTKELFNELLEYTMNEWTENYLKIEGLNGRLFTSKINSEQIFIPASGDKFQDRVDGDGSYCSLWSSSLNTDYPSGAWLLGFYSGGIRMSGIDRDYGFTVRPVLD